MKTAALLSLALSIGLALALPVEAASLAVGKKAEINVDAKKMDEERASLWKKFGGWCSSPALSLRLKRHCSSNTTSRPAFVRLM